MSGGPRADPREQFVISSFQMVSWTFWVDPNHQNIFSSMGLLKWGNEYSSWRAVIVWDEDKRLIVNLSGREDSIILKLLGGHCCTMERDSYSSSRDGYQENVFKEAEWYLNEPSLMRCLVSESRLHLGSII